MVTSLVKSGGVPARLAHLSVIISVTTMTVGALVLFGWAMDIEFLKRIVPGFASMNPMTASMFMLAGLSLALHHRAGDSSDPNTVNVASRTAGVIAFIVLGFGLLVCANFVLGWGLGVDQQLFPEKLAAELPGMRSRVAVSTGLCFVLAGFALLSLDLSMWRVIRPAQFLAIAVMCISFIGIEGYIYGVLHSYVLDAFSAMALHSAVVFGLLGFGILSVRPRAGIMKLFADDFPGSIMLTRGFPLIAILVGLAGWLRYEGELIGYYNGAMGVALYSLISIVIIGVVLLWCVNLMRNMEVNHLHLEKERNRFFDLTRDLVCVASTDGYFLQVNSAFATTLGYTQEELLRHPFASFIHPEDLEASQALVASLSAGGQDSSFFVNRYRCKDGSWKTLSWSTRTFPEERKLYASARDITELMVVQSALTAREEELSITLESIGDAVLSTDVDGRVTRLNTTAQDLTGWTESEAIGLPIDTVFCIINEHTRLPVVSSIGEALAAGSIRGLANYTLLVARDGRERPIDARYAPRRNSAGEVVGAVLTFRDISEAQRAAKEVAVAHALAHSESDRLKTVLDTVVDGVIGIDVMGEVQSFNPAAERLYGYRAEEVIGRSIKMLAPDTNSEELEGYFNEYRDTGPRKIFDFDFESEVTGLRKDGSLFPMEFSVVETNSEDDWKLTCVVRDISERTHFIAEMQSAREQADAANAAKSAFLATMSHEIRTPMNGVIGMLDVLHQTSLRGYQVEMIELIKDSALSLLTIINDILDFSKIEAGKMEVCLAPFDVGATVENVCVMMDRFAEKSHSELTMFIDPTSPALLLGDAQHLRQVLINLINNAVKFSSKRADSEGCVSVRTECVQRDTDEIIMEFRVCDNGIGMDEDTQAKLFLPFEQGKASIARRFGGTGLGLVISQNLTQTMGGDIRVESTLGFGSTFIVRLPFRIAKNAPARDEDRADVSGLSCLVIGQPQGIAPALAKYLVHGGARVERLDSLELAREWARGRKGGEWICVIDAGNSHPTLADLNAVMRTGSEWDVRFLAVVIERGKRHNLRQKGAGVFMIDGNALCRNTFLLAVAVAAGRKLPDEAFPPGDANYGEKTRLVSRTKAIELGRLILVAEDNETNQKVIAKQLELLGIAADITSNGFEALERWRRGSYPLLLTDLHMPDMDGIELAAAIRAEEVEPSHIGIVALTANTLPGDAEYCLLNGMDDYLSKPAQLEDIKKVVNKWLPALEMDSTGIQPSEEESQLSTSPSSNLLSADTPVDVSVLEGLVGDDPEIVRDFLADFRRSAAVIRSELHTAWRSGALQEVGAVSHKLKSSARTVGAVVLGDRCEHIETAVNEGQVAEVKDLIHLFDQAYIAVDQYLESY